MTKDVAKPLPRDMILIPGTLPAGVFDAHDAEVFNHNRRWSGQWKAKRPGERGTEEIAARASLSAVVAVFNRAARQANGKEVILFAGHGADSAISSLNQAAFDLAPEPGLMSTHANVITDEVTKLGDVAERKAGKWVPKRITRPDGTIFTESQANIDRLSPRFEALEQIGAALKGENVTQLRLLTCDVGLEPAFADRVAKITGMRIVAYLDLVQTNEFDYTFTGKPTITKIQIFVAKVGTAPPAVNNPTSFPPDAAFNDQAAFTEIPPQPSTVSLPPP